MPLHGPHWAFQGPCLLGFTSNSRSDPFFAVPHEGWHSANATFCFIQPRGSLEHRVNCRDNGSVQLTACPQCALSFGLNLEAHPSLPFSTATYLLHPLLSCRRGPLWWPGSPRVTWKKWWPPAAYVEPRRPDLGGASLGKARSRGERAPGRRPLPSLLCLCFSLQSSSPCPPRENTLQRRGDSFPNQRRSIVLTKIPVYLTLLTSTVNDSASLAGPSAICNYKYMNR